MTNVTIQSRDGVIEGKRNGEIAFFDCFDRRSEKDIRHFILFKYGVKLRFEPYGWKNEWYIDFIDIEFQADNLLILTDLYLDMVIEGMGPTYRIVDAEELAEAYQEGNIDSDRLCLILKNLQIFVDDHLHRGIDNFPPQVILPYFDRQTA